MPFVKKPSLTRNSNTIVCDGDRLSMFGAYNSLCINCSYFIGRVPKLPRAVYEVTDVVGNCPKRYPIGHEIKYRIYSIDLS